MDQESRNTELAKEDAQTAQERPVEVSVICNVYNHARYLKDALSGFVMQQTNFRFEVLVHDDASTDDSAEIIREYERKYPDIIKPLYQTENQYSKKVGITREIQMPRAKGRYIALCEGDDYWTDPLKLQKQYDYMTANEDCYLCVCSTNWQNMMTGRIENRGKTDRDKEISLEEIILEKNGRIFQLASFFMRRELMEDLQPWRKAFPIGDYPLAVDAALRGKVWMIADAMCVYRYYAAGSWTQRMDTDEHRAYVSKRMIEALIQLNEATDNKYDAVITQRIRKHQYTYGLMTHDLNAILSAELRPIFNSRNILLRCSDFMRCKYPKLYGVLKKVVRRVV